MPAVAVELPSLVCGLDNLVLWVASWCYHVSTPLNLRSFHGESETEISSSWLRCTSHYLPYTKHWYILASTTCQACWSQLPVTRSVPMLYVYTWCMTTVLFSFLFNMFFLHSLTGMIMIKQCTARWLPIIIKYNNGWATIHLDPNYCYNPIVNYLKLLGSTALCFKIGFYSFLTSGWWKQNACVIMTTKKSKMIPFSTFNFQKSCDRDFCAKSVVLWHRWS